MSQNQPKPEGAEISRHTGRECGGRCSHSIAFHVVRLRDENGNYTFACSRVDCSCMEWVEPKIKLKDEALEPLAWEFPDLEFP